MKKTFGSLLLLSILSVGAFASGANSGTVQLPSATKVGSTELPAGSYKVTWTGTGDNAQVTLKQGKYSATTTAQIVEAKKTQKAIATKTENGSRILTQIQFQDKTLVLHDAPSQVAGQ